jgi:WD40 repeat protein
MLQREVALKVPQVADERTRTRFLREAKAAAQLHHPNIVPIHDAGFDGEHCYIASAFIEGGTLAAAIEQGGIGLRQAAMIVVKLASALAYAHGQGVVHRDVKPANVMLDSNGEPHLMDFGIALLQDSEEKLTRDGAILGTPAYMSPEQAGAPGGVESPTDQFSLGVVLYELLCGHLPFSGPIESLIYQIRHEDPPAPRSVRPDIPRDLETVCLKCLEREPCSRYETCAGLAEDLSRWCRGDAVSVRRRTIVERILRWMHRKPMEAGLFSTVACLVFFIAVGSSIAAFWLANAQTELRKALTQAESNEMKYRREAELHRAASQHAESQSQLATERAREAVAAQEKAEAAQRESEEARATAENALAAKLAAERDRDVAAADASSKGEALETISGRLDEETRKLEDTEKKHAEALSKYHSIAKDRDRELLDTTKLVLYAKNVVAAQKQLGRGDVKNALRMLADCPEEYRGWEWRYLESLCMPLTGKSLRLVTTINGPPMDLVSAARVRESQTDGTSPLRPFALTFSPDGKLLACGGSRAVTIVEIETEKKVGEFLDHSAPVDKLEFSSSGNMLAAQCVDGSLQIWSRGGAAPNRTPANRKMHWHFEATRDALVLDGIPREQPNGIKTNHIQLIDLNPPNQSLSLRVSSEYLSDIAIGPPKSEADGCIVSLESTLLTRDVHIPGNPGSPGTPSTPSISLPNGGTVPGSPGSPPTPATPPTTIPVPTGFRDVFFVSGSQQLGWKTSRTQLAPSQPVASALDYLEFSNDGILFVSNSVTDAGASLRAYDISKSQDAGQMSFRATCLRRFFLPIDKRFPWWRPSPSGRWIAVQAFDGKARTTSVALCSAYCGSPFIFVPSDKNDTLAYAWSREGDRLATADSGGTMKIWQVSPDMPPGPQIICGHTGSIKELMFTPDGKSLITACIDGTLFAHTGEGKLERVERMREALAISRDCERVVLSTPEGAQCFDLKNEKMLYDIADRSMKTCCFSPDGTMLAMVREQLFVDLIDASTGETHKSIRLGDINCSELCFNPTGTHIATVGGDRIVVWDTDSGDELLSLNGHAGGAYSLDYSPGGDWIISGGRDKTIKLWDATTGREAFTIKDNFVRTGGIATVRFFRDGERIISVGDNKISVWDVRTGQRLILLDGHSDRVTCVAISPDGTRIASGDAGGTVIMWNAPDAGR